MPSLTPTVASHNTVTEKQLFGFGNSWFYTFKKDLCLEQCYLIYLVKIIQQSIYKMWKNNNIISQLNQWKLCVGYPQTVHHPSCCWQHKSCYSNILLLCLSWTMYTKGFWKISNCNCLLKNFLPVRRYSSWKLEKGVDLIKVSRYCVLIFSCKKYRNWTRPKKDL